jgi:hypothetical protein
MRVIDSGPSETDRSQKLTWQKSKSPKLDGMYSKIKCYDIYNYVHMV